MLGTAPLGWSGSRAMGAGERLRRLSGGSTTWRASGEKTRQGLRASASRCTAAGRVRRCWCCTAAAAIRAGCRTTRNWRRISASSAPTYPGFGPSGRSHQWFFHRTEGLDGLIWFYHRFLKSQELGPLPVIGFCMGGWLAMEIAARYPLAFSRMVLVGAPGLKAPDHDPFQMSAEEAKAALFHDVRAGTGYLRPAHPEGLPKRRPRLEDVPSVSRCTSTIPSSPNG